MIFALSLLTIIASKLFYLYLFCRYGAKAIAFIITKTFFFFRNFTMRLKVPRKTFNLEQDLVFMYSLYKKAEGITPCSKEEQIKSYTKLLKLSSKYDISYKELEGLFTPQ